MAGESVRRKSVRRQLLLAELAVFHHRTDQLDRIDVGADDGIILVQGQQFKEHVMRGIQSPRAVFPDDDPAFFPVSGDDDITGFGLDGRIDQNPVTFLEIRHHRGVPDLHGERPGRQGKMRKQASLLFAELDGIAG